MQHLERDRPVVPQVLGEENGSHAAAPELALEGVRWGEGRLQLRAQVRQTARFVEVGLKCIQASASGPAGMLPLGLTRVLTASGNPLSEMNIEPRRSGSLARSRHER